MQALENQNMQLVKLRESEHSDSKLLSLEKSLVLGLICTNRIETIFK